MQSVTASFSGAVNSNYRTVNNGILISWDKQTASGIQYFTIGTSVIGGSDILKTTGGGTIAAAQLYDYTKIPSSGIVSWNTSMSLDQYPYGIVQRQADVVLNNASTAYLAASGTALGPNIDSGRPVIIQTGFGGETIPMFTGYSDTPVNDINARTTSLHCYDAMDFLNSYTSIATAPLQNKTSDQVIAALLAEAGFSTSQYILEGSLNSAIPYLDPFGLMIGDIIGRLCEAEGAIFFSDESGIMHFWNRQHFSHTATPVATLSYSNIASLQQQNSPVMNSIKVSSNPLSLVSGVKNVYSLNQPYYIKASGPNSTNQFQNPSFEVSTSGWSGNGVRTSNASKVGSYSLSGTNLTYDMSQSVVSSSDGLGFKATVQAWFKPPSGTVINFLLTGSPVAGQSIIGTSSTTVSGTGSWINKSLSAQHYNMTSVAGINSFVSSQPLPITSSFISPITQSGYVYMIGSNKVSQSNLVFSSQLTPGIAGFALTNGIAYDYGAFAGRAVITNSGNIYHIGGLYSNGSSLAWRSYVTSPGKLAPWTAATPLPVRTYFNAATTYSGYVYSLGGQQDTVGVISGVVNALSDGLGNLSAWSTVNALPGRRESGTAIAVNSYIYYFGGYDQTGIAISTVYYAKINSDGTLGSWNTTTSLPSINITNGQVVQNNGYIYLVGGIDNTGTTGTEFNTVYYAKINSDGTLGSWTQTQSFTTGRDSAAVFTNGNYLYIVGGENLNGDLSDSQYAPFLGSGLTLTASGTKPFYLDAVSSDINLEYFDGDTADTQLATYSWQGTTGLSSSVVTPVATYLNIQASLSEETFSLIQPVASGLNNPNIGASQSFYSFSSVSGTGGIFGTDITSNISLVNYSVSGTTAFLTFQNNTSNQGYLTNLVLYGQVAEGPSNQLSASSSDSTSIGKYRLNPNNNGQLIEIDNDYIATTADASGLAQYLVTGYSTPLLRHSTANFAIPQLQFGDCVQLVNRDTGETRIGFILGISNSCDNQGNFTQNLIIQERNVQSYFTIGSSTIGGQAHIAP